MITTSEQAKRPPMTAADIDRVCDALNFAAKEREALRKHAHAGDPHARFTVSALMLQRVQRDL